MTPRTSGRPPDRSCRKFACVHDQGELKVAHARVLQLQRQIQSNADVQAVRGEYAELERRFKQLHEDQSVSMRQRSAFQKTSKTLNLQVVEAGETIASLSAQVRRRSHFSS